MSSKYLEEFERALANWTDHRFVSDVQIRAMSMFHMYLVNLSEGDGWQYDGHSLKLGVPMCTLTVKSTIDGVPQVVFTSARTSIACVVVFIRKLESGLLEWRDDRYRQ